MPATSDGPAGLVETEGTGVPPRSRREPLTRERIIRTALRIMDEDGLEAVTMRRIGRELGVEAMSLYNHVADKEDILSGVIEAVMGEFEFPEESEDWKETARRTARAWRDLLNAHPNVITLMSEERKPLMTSVRALRPIQHALRILRRLGLSEAESVRTYRSFAALIFGFVTMEVSNMFGGEKIAVSSEDLARALPLDLLPDLASCLPHLFNCDLDAEFEYALDLMIRGLEAKLADGAR